MPVRAKFVCESVETSPNIQPPDESLKVVKLRAVYTGSVENAEFFKWTPSAEISLATVNTAAAEQFVAGAEYYVDFTKATAGCDSNADYQITFGPAADDYTHACVRHVGALLHDGALNTVTAVETPLDSPCCYGGAQ